MNDESPKTMVEAVKYFADPKVYFTHMLAQVWRRRRWRGRQPIHAAMQETGLP
jgi:hypothetical protein